jgi:hypothetical protein
VRLHALLLNALTVCDTPAEFQTFLNAQSLTLYHRGGRPYGLIAAGKKYRFTTLGLQPQLEQAIKGWQQAPAFERAFQNSTAERLRQEWRRETGYAAEIAAVIHMPNPPPPPDPMEQQSRYEIGAAIQAHRQHRRALYLDGSSRNR